MARTRQTTTTAEARLDRLDRGARRAGLSPVRDGRALEVEHAGRLLRITCSGRTTMKVMSFVTVDEEYVLDAYSVMGDVSTEGTLYRLAQVEPS